MRTLLDNTFRELDDGQIYFRPFRNWTITSYKVTSKKQKQNLLILSLLQMFTSIIVVLPAIIYQSLWLFVVASFICFIGYIFLVRGCTRSLVKFDETIYISKEKKNKILTNSSLLSVLSLIIFVTGLLISIYTNKVLGGNVHISMALGVVFWIMIHFSIHQLVLKNHLQNIALDS